MASIFNLNNLRILKKLPTACQLLRTGIILMFLGGTPCFGQYTYYSDLSADDDWNIIGWGVTDVTSYAYQHQAAATVTLRSPNGRITFLSGGDYNYVRTDVMLVYDESDLGEYTVSTEHFGECSAMGTILHAFSYAYEVFSNKQLTYERQFIYEDGNEALYKRCNPPGTPCDTARGRRIDFTPPHLPVYMIANWFVIETGQFWTCIGGKKIAADSCVPDPRP